MLGFLLKIVILGVMVFAGYFIVYPRISPQISTTNPLTALSQLPSKVQSVDVRSLGTNLSSTLDSLVTHSDRSPMVMGIQITNQSLAAVVDTLQNLPPGELQQVKNFLCQPATSSGAQK